MTLRTDAFKCSDLLSLLDPEIIRLLMKTTLITFWQFYIHISHIINVYSVKKEAGKVEGKGQEIRVPQIATSFYTLLAILTTKDAQCLWFRDKKKERTDRNQVLTITIQSSAWLCVALCTPKEIKQNRLIQSNKSSKHSPNLVNDSGHITGDRELDHLVATCDKTKSSFTQTN